ncbi:MAG: acVLRF1 family peptidyl-tRNA hydrolase [Candidatus Dormibacteraceae bacterium]
MSAPSRRVEVAPERLRRWLAGWTEGREPVRAQVTSGLVTFTGADGGEARCRVPFPPLPEGDQPAGDRLVAHVLRDRTVAVLLCRRGGHAAGVFRGRLLVASKVGSRLVHGRSAAGGWSQHRFERRRANQARDAWARAADDMGRILDPWRERLDAVVVGGDREALTALAADPRLAPLLARAEERRLDDLPTPRRAVLEQAPRRYRAVLVDLRDPTS